MYETMEQRQAILDMTAADRIRHLFAHAQGQLDTFDRLAVRVLTVERLLQTIQSAKSGFVEAVMLSAKMRDAFHAISWNVKHYPFVKPHHEQCHGFGTVLRDGQPFELSGSMGCPGDHCGLSEDAVGKFVDERLEEALAFLNGLNDMQITVCTHALGDESDFFAITARGGTDYGPAMETILSMGGQAHANWNRYIFTAGGEDDGGGGRTLLADLNGFADFRPRPLPEGKRD